MRRFDLETTRKRRAVRPAAPPSAAGAVLSGRRAFGTGCVRPGAGCHRGRAGPLSDGLSPPGRRNGTNDCRGAVCRTHLLPLSVAGLFAGVHLAGVLLLPCATVAYGFFLSFSVCCFTAAFGSDGVLLALAVFGLRCAVTLPCYLLLAVPAWGTSATLASFSFGRGRRAAPVVYGRSCWVRFGGVMAALLTGMCVDLFLSPWLLQLILERILGAV